MSDEATVLPVIGERWAGDVVILSVQRGLKGEGESTLRDRIDALVREGKREVLIDLGKMPHMDSTELGRLIRSHISVRHAGGRVRLCNLPSRVMELMKMSRLDTILDIFGTEEEALAAIGGAHSERSGGGAGGGV